MVTELTISRAAERAGVGIETIRFFERRGLIKQPPRPRGGGFRFYGGEIVERICFIRQAQELGFSLREIKELLSLRADPGADCGDVQRQAVIKRAEVNHKIAQLQQIRAALDALIASCPGGGALRACTVIDAMAGRYTAEAGWAASAANGPLHKARRRHRTTKGSSVKTIIFKI